MQSKEHSKNFVIKMKVNVNVRSADLSATLLSLSGFHISDNKQRYVTTRNTRKQSPNQSNTTDKVAKVGPDLQQHNHIADQSNFVEKRQHPRWSAKRRIRLFAPLNAFKMSITQRRTDNTHLVVTGSSELETWTRCRFRHDSELFIY